MNKRKMGAEWEKVAAAFLTAQGMRVVERNFRCRQGEIDLIGYHQGYLVFVEVKYRSSTQKGYAVEAVDVRKQRKICRVSDYYRYIHKVDAGVSVRYDVIAIQGEELSWIQDAFCYMQA